MHDVAAQVIELIKFYVSELRFWAGIIVGIYIARVGLSGFASGVRQFTSGFVAGYKRERNK